MFSRFQHPRPMISGVCAWLADRSAVPVWLVRLVALGFLVAHFPALVILYLVAAYVLRRQAKRDRQDAMPDGFAHLDRRLARMEETAWRAQYRG